MNQSAIPGERWNHIFLLIVAAVISAVFFLLAKPFLVTLLLAGIFAGMAAPFYRWFYDRFKRRKTLAAATTILIVLLVIVVPFSAFIGLAASQATDVTRSIGPWVEQQVQRPGALDQLLDRLPFGDLLRPYRAQVTQKLGELASAAGGFLIGSVASATRGTVAFLFHLFIMLYAMFFFLIDGKSILHKILYYLPLGRKDEELMVSKFVSVTRATLKGTLVIGLAQGGLAGAAFAIAGIPGFAFWGTVMVVLSIVPGIGTALVWVPASIYLAATNHVMAAVLVALWCGIVVGTVDNLLRPRLIGRDTKMSDLMILIGTLGGIVVFGAVGFIIGPIITALFVTVWELYGEAFSEYLPDTGLAETS